MRMQKISVLTLVAVAAGLSLTACDNGSDSSSAPASSSAAGSDSQSQAGSDQAGSAGSAKTDSTSAHGAGTRISNNSGSAADAGPKSGSGHASGSACRTANLGFTTSGAMAEGELIINLKNNGAGTCTLHGFPGVDLKGRDGTVSATRNKAAAPDVSVAPGDETRFTLHYPPNNSGGSGVTFTSLVVTPPNETHSHTIAQNINIPASQSGPAISVDPVGSGK
ncbi:DUF4232 domain-containing protein [Streptomyces sp. SID10853]|uniref:DUF4232 domain-containing protein n=1 Tax=Streptomyces sp. SID10853 TaxID=2706028 RepID=UPI0013C25767|nr:DUF4232 domain-containing protein [Streptomyces sp. SID10853]NDZ79079.1 DUF4232 domain-containing protein [Streptomyces sp. SID10853]